MKTFDQSGGRGAKPAPAADDLAVQVLTYIAADPERLDRFLSLTGLDPTSLRSAATRRGFTAAILAYLGSDDALLVAFADHERMRPEKVAHVIRIVTEPPEPDL